ncbi:hypothetical protein EVAR_51582_1 [Eumeta japonica]|uniref:Uncharacterized protein n=1 Tax=Eumeta variegata TaxID=151549 RepID=A0A4C1YJT8_EUMVA|nr:hypothetical protein EVAR_51582_1 [Eumeta japonica]
MQLRIGHRLETLIHAEQVARYITCIRNYCNRERDHDWGLQRERDCNRNCERNRYRDRNRDWHQHPGGTGVGVECKTKIAIRARSGPKQPTDLKLGSTLGPSGGTRDKARHEVGRFVVTAISVLRFWPPNQFRCNRIVRPSVPGNRSESTDRDAGTRPNSVPNSFLFGQYEAWRRKHKRIGSASRRPAPRKGWSGQRGAVTRRGRAETRHPLISR